MHLPGMMTCFTYDEFYPDPYFDNTQAATEDCIKCILQKMPFDFMPHFKNDNLRLNHHYPINEQQFKQIVNQFKTAYENIEIVTLKDAACNVDENKSTVDGDYALTVTTGNETSHLSGTWEVSFEKMRSWATGTSME